MHNPSLPTYRTAIDASWIDYNGHLRDAYYGLIFSFAIDDLMDQLGIDAAYRTRTLNTLFTLEMHVYYLQEVKHSDPVVVSGGILNADQKRIHGAFSLGCARLPQPAATAEFMLLHVHQGATTRSAPFPEDIHQRVQALRILTAAHPALGAASRKIELR